MSKWTPPRSDGNGGYNIGKMAFALLLAIVGAVGLTTGDMGDFFDGPAKVKRMERFEAELAHLTQRFEEHVEGNINERREASAAVDARLDELAKRMEAQTQRLDAIYRLLVEQRNGPNGDR